MYDWLNVRPLEHAEAMLILKRKKRKPGSRAGMTREKIASAAATQLEKSGGDFSLRQLARTLGVAPTTISSHFKGGLTEIEDEVVRITFADVAPPYRPLQSPTDYIENAYMQTLSTLRGRPMLSMLAILRLTHNPLLVPNFAERALTSLAAMGVAPDQIALAYRALLEALFGLIVGGPARAYTRSKSEKLSETFDLSRASKGEHPQLFAAKDAIIADVEATLSWEPNVEVVRLAVQRLTDGLKRLKGVAPVAGGGEDNV